MITLPLKVARVIMGHLMKGRFRAIKQLSKVLGRDTNSLIKEATKYTRNAANKGINSKPITGRFVKTKDPKFKQEYNFKKDNYYMEHQSDPNITKFSETNHGKWLNKMKNKKHKRWREWEDDIEMSYNRDNPLKESYLQKELMPNKGLMRQVFNEPAPTNLKKIENRFKTAGIWPKKGVSGADKRALQEANTTYDDIQAHYRRSRGKMLQEVAAENEIEGVIQHQRMSKKKKSQKILEQLQKLARKKSFEA